MALNYLQNDVLEIGTKFVPLSSSNTQSGMSGDEGGRPTKEDTTSESTVANRENGTDAERKASET